VDIKALIKRNRELSRAARGPQKRNRKPVLDAEAVARIRQAFADGVNAGVPVSFDDLLPFAGREVSTATIRAALLGLGAYADYDTDAE